MMQHKGCITAGEQEKCMLSRELLWQHLLSLCACVSELHCCVIVHQQLLSDCMKGRRPTPVGFTMELHQRDHQVSRFDKKKSYWFKKKAEMCLSLKERHPSVEFKLNEEKNGLGWLFMCWHLSSMTWRSMLLHLQSSKHNSFPSVGSIWFNLI